MSVKLNISQPKPKRLYVVHTGSKDLMKIKQSGERRLENRRKKEETKNKMTSVGLTALVMLVVLIVLSFIKLSMRIESEENMITVHSAPKSEETTENNGGKAKGGIKNNKANRLPTPPPAAAKMLAVPTPAPISLDMPEISAKSPSLNFGEEIEFGGSWEIDKTATEIVVASNNPNTGLTGQGGNGGNGNGTGTGTGDGSQNRNFEKLPNVMQNRCGDARVKRLLEAGGTPETEIAIQKTVDWLLANQRPDGSWKDKMRGYIVADTAMSILVLTGSCEVGEDSIAREAFTKGVVYLIDYYKKNGTFASPGCIVTKSYEYAITAYALAEAYVFCEAFGIEIPDLKKTTISAGNAVMGGQQSKGGWDYVYGAGETDTSIGIWQIQAVYACQITKLWPEKNFQAIYDKFMQWVVEIQLKNGAVGYKKRVPNESTQLTCGTYLAFHLGGRKDSAPAKLMFDYIKKMGWLKPNLKGAPYYQYYLFQAMISHGGEEWDNYHPILRDALIGSQLPTGAWSASGAEYQGVGNHIATCMAALTLQTYYRHLPPKQVGK